jgi:membrane protease YdiL (CAAX protease family)
MNFLENGLTGKNNLWRYIVVIAATFAASNTIGAAPMIIAFFLKYGADPSALSHITASGISGLDPYTGLFVMIFPFIVALATFLILIKPVNQRTIKSVITGSKKIRWSHYFISAAVWLVISAIYLFVYLKIDPSNFILNNKSITLIFISLIAIFLIPFQAAYEEVIFRGYLMQGLSKVLRFRWFPLIMTSVMFGLLHAFNPEVKEFGFLTMMPQYILFGLIFGVITVMDDGIEASMGAHAANNIFLVIMVTNKSSALQSPALFEQIVVRPWTEFTGLLLSGLAFILILKIIFKWQSFSLLMSSIPVKMSGDNEA